MTRTDSARDRNDEATPWESREVAEAWRRMAPVHARTFGAATETLLDLAGVAEGDHVLDVAAGTGEQTLAAARRVGTGGSVLATDVSATMLDVARDVLREAGLSNVEARVMDAQRLDLPANSFDAAISRFGVMLIPEPERALDGIRRALKPGARLAAMVWSAAEKNPIFTVALAVIRRYELLPPPDPTQPNPFTLGDPSLLVEKLRRAGYGDVDVRAIRLSWEFPSVADTLDYYRISSASLGREVQAAMGTAAGQRAWADIEQELQRFESADGLTIPGEALIGVGAR